MTSRAFKYDVAFSFLAADSPIALALHDEISESNPSFAFRESKRIWRDAKASRN